MRPFYGILKKNTSPIKADLDTPLWSKAYLKSLTLWSSHPACHLLPDPCGFSSLCPSSLAKSLLWLTMLYITNAFLANFSPVMNRRAFLVAQMVESACNVWDPGSIPGLGSSPGEGNGNPLQHSYLKNPTDGGAWRAIQSMGVTKSWTWLEWLTYNEQSSYFSSWIQSPKVPKTGQVLIRSFS